jgi:hypothetical protein
VPALNTISQDLFVQEHGGLLNRALDMITELEGFDRRLQSNAGVAYAQHFDFAARALGLRLYLKPALDLAASGEYMPAFAILRSALEHHLVDRLIFLATRYKTVHEGVQRADFDQLYADWKAQKPTLRHVVDIQWKNGTVVIIHSGLHPDNGDSTATISRYYFLVQDFDPFIGHPTQQEFLAREFWPEGQHKLYAQQQQGIYSRNLRWDQIKSNLVYNSLCSEEDVRRFDVHYTFLSAFVHSVQRGFELLYGRNRPADAPRYEHSASELVLLYINKLATGELVALQQMSRRSPQVGLREWDSVEAKISLADAAASHLWFPGDPPHAYDRVQEANSRGMREGKFVPRDERPKPDQLHIDEIRYYRNPLQRLRQMHSSFYEMTGYPYQSPWPRSDARFRWRRP